MEQRRPSGILLKSFTWRQLIGASISRHPVAEAAGSAGGIANGPVASREFCRSEQRFSVPSALMITFYPYPAPSSLSDLSLSRNIISCITNSAQQTCEE
jgi:hypothetical protein